MTLHPKQTFRQAFWRDLTGQSDHWGRTLVLAVVVGRLSFMALGMFIVLIAGEGADDNFSGIPDALTEEWIIASLAFAPLVESLAICFVVWLLGSQKSLGWPVWATSLACGVLAVPYHGLSLASLSVLPLFAIMAAIQHHWMNRGKGWPGFWLIVAIHLVVNALGLLAMALLWPEIAPPT